MLFCKQGWDKTYCLRFVEGEYDEIHFFGDKTFPVSSSTALAMCLANVPSQLECHAVELCSVEQVHLLGVVVRCTLEQGECQCLPHKVSNVLGSAPAVKRRLYLMWCCCCRAATTMRYSHQRRLLATP
jgi:flavin reductase (DIM6/NTAB) family NADH-FMN oxidoreductase RutF